MTYLGIKLGFGKQLLRDYDDFDAKVDSRLASWKRNSLSQAGRLVLINSVLGAMPNNKFANSVVPKGVTNSLSRKIRDFLWKKRNNKKRPASS